MPELASILEREGDTVDLEPGGYDRLLRRHDRRRRNRRIGSALLAFAIAATTIGYAYAVFHRGTEPIPMNQITSRNVGRLGLAWSAGSISTADEGSPTVRDGIVYAVVETTAVSGVVQGFPAACPATGGLCNPEWSTSRPIETEHAGIVVGKRSVYTLESLSSTHPFAGFNSYRIDADPRSCGADRCRPSWTTRIVYVRQAGGMNPVAEIGRILYVRVGSRLQAYAPSCGRSVCEPIWTGRNVGPPTIVNGRAVVRTSSGVATFSSACWEARGPACHAIWTARIDVGAAPAQLPPPVVADGHVLVDDPRGVLAFPIDCGSSCTPDWHANVPTGPGFEPVVANGTMFTAANGGSDLYAFSIDCSEASGAGTCEPAWVGHAADGVGFAPLVSDGHVLVASALGSELTAFPVSCAGECVPAWSAQLDDSITFAPIASNDLVLVSGLGSVSAYTAACTSPCDPVFHWGLPGGTPETSPFVEGDSMIIVGGNTMYALRLGAAAPEAERSRSWTRQPAIVPLLVAGAVLVMVAATRRRRRAFP
jgi:outer membrane protein assembly factor BamB